MKKIITITFAVYLSIFLTSCSAKEESNQVNNNIEPISSTEATIVITPSKEPTPTKIPATITPTMSVTSSPQVTSEVNEQNLDTSEQNINTNVVITSNPVLNDDNLLLVTISQDQLKIQELADDKLVHDVFTENSTYWFPFYIQKNMLLLISDDELGLFDISTNQFMDKIPDAYPRGFLKNKPYILYETYQEETEVSTIYIYDYEKKFVMNSFEGCNATLSSMDDSILFLRYNIDEGEDGGEIDILSYDVENNKIIELNKVELNDYVYNIRGLTSLSKDYYVYSVYDEHEIRYYNNKNQEIMSSKKSGKESDDELNYKEQYDFSFSSDGKLACFAERNWNSLTYIVHGNSQSTEMVKTDYLGSFPVYHQGKIYFISDPSFVKLGENEGFRQIEDYALYYYDIDKKELKLVLQPKLEFCILERN